MKLVREGKDDPEVTSRSQQQKADKDNLKAGLNNVGEEALNSHLYPLRYPLDRQIA